MAHHALGGAYGNPVGVVAEGTLDACGLGSVAGNGCVSVGVDVTDGFGETVGVGQGAGYGLGHLRAVGP